ncbi:MAG: hypothetical protein AAGA85_04140 [Bacteroidota bacterium]
MKHPEILVLLFSFGFFLGCSHSGKHTFEEINCYPDNELGTIYTSCTKFVYEVKFWDHDYDLISESRAQLFITGLVNTAMNGQRQVEGIYQYEYFESDINRVAPFNINKTMEDTSWVDRATQALMETPADVWITPFRHNQFKFTQVSPYPSVNLPLELGKQWTSNLVMYDGWGDWDNQQLISNYQVIGQEALDLPFETLAGTWHVKATVSTNLGVNELDFWFHESYGFVKMIYRNYGGQLLQFELTEVAT